MKTTIIIAAATAVAGGITWLFATKKGKDVRQAIVDQSGKLADTVKKTFQQEMEKQQNLQGNSTAYANA